MNSYPQVEGYSYVNLVMRTTVETGDAGSAQTRRMPQLVVGIPGTLTS
jgi:hypothetical protein